jgi:hypothetical protein
VLAHKIAPEHRVSGIFRIELDRLVVVRYGAVVIALDEVREAAAGAGCSMFRIEPDRLTVIRNGADVIALSEVRVAAAGEGVAFFGSSRIAPLKSAMARS